MIPGSFVAGIARRLVGMPIDSVVHPAEAHYAEAYLALIRTALGNRRQLRILDCGCGAGRLLVPVAKEGHLVVGIDRHRPSLHLARSHLAEAGLRADVIAGNLLDVLTQMSNDSFDVALAIESLYVNRSYRQVMHEMRRVVAPGGLLLITHRTRHFLLLQSIAERHFDDAVLICSRSEGRLRKGPHRVYYNWQTREHIQMLYSELDLNLVRLAGIGFCSGFGRDPLAAICNPAKLDRGQRDVLRRVEACDDADLVMASRYVLAIAEKPAVPQY